MKKGVRPSYHRIRVLEYLYQQQGHPTAEDIFTFLSPQIPSLSRATIYNTLHSFVAAGLVRVISIDGIEQRYDVMLHNHGHFKCQSCGGIVNFKIDFDSILTEDLSHYEVHERNIYFNGICPKCLNQHKVKEK